MRGLPVALRFLTRIPLPPAAMPDARAQAASLAWYPLVGGIIGGVLCACGWLLQHALPQPAPTLLAAAIMLAAWVALTGALHLDGLADSADAWIGGMGDRERTLTIMKDPRSGPVAIVVVVLVLLLKFAALASLPQPQWIAVLLAPLLARAALVALVLTTSYVRAGGLGEALQSASRSVCTIALLLAVAGTLLAGWRGAIALMASTLVFAVLRRACLRRLGGFTGDTAGACVEIIEVVVLLVFALATTR